MQASSNKGLFITLEGIEGSGKSFHLHHIADFLQQQGWQTCTTREPGGSPLAEHIRAFLLKEYQTEEILVPEAETLLFYAARAQHIRYVIQPNLAKGIAVISDRFLDSSYAYQQAGRAVSASQLDYLTQWIVNTCIPDITFVFDLPVEQAMQRIQNRSLDRIEQEDFAFHQRVRQAYLARVLQNPQRCILIDSSQEKDAVSHAVKQHLSVWIQKYPAKLNKPAIN